VTSGRPVETPRRALLTGGAAALLLGGSASEPDFAGLEARTGGRLGVSALDLSSGRRLGYRANDHFPLCSTFKVLLAAAVLARVDAGQEALDRRIAVSRADLVAYSPVVEAHVDGALTVEAACEAIMTVSDNAAANLLLRTVGGPAGLTLYLRALGDRITRLDRYEPELNVVPAGDTRDTTTPTAMVDTLRRLLTSQALAPASRARLAAWMVAASTGVRRLRAATPAGWRAGDKSGTWAGQAKSVNDVAAFWPPGGGLVLVAAYLTNAAAELAACEAVLADAGRLALQAFGERA